MAKNKVDLGCTQLKGVFTIKGKVTGRASNNFYVEGTGQNNRPWRKVHFGVEFEKGKIAYMDLFGAAQENCYISKTTNVSGNKKQTETLQIPWANRFDYTKDARYKGYRMIGITCGCTKKIDDKGNQINDVKYLTSFDACEEICNIHDGDSVFIRGNIVYSTYNDTHRINFEPSQVSLCAPIDFDDIGFEPHAHFTQPIVLMGVEKNEDAPGEAIVSAKIVNYQSIEDTELFTRNAGLAKNLKKLKDYCHIKVWGDIDIETGIEEVAVDEGWGTANAMERVSSPAKRKLVITGADPESIDKESYSESIIEHALEVIASIQSAKEDYGKKDLDSEWGQKGDSNLDDEEDDDFDLGI